MSKISRADSKARFRTGMYPTQADFENLHDSYVHKDDTIPLEQVGTNGATVVSLLNQKANSSHSHEIADVNGLEKFVTEMTSLLEIVRDPETGEISQSKLKTLTDGIASLRDDIDTNTDNVAGHESRIQTNEAALEKVYQILGKDDKESIDDLANRFAALSGNYANVYAFVNKVKQFLEDADASDETINRWQEIEAFLQGVTDTQTLTGLLEQQRTDLEVRIAEAIAAIPKVNYLKLVADLDAYTDAPDGEIVKYTGETNDKYTHGWDYERVAEGGTTIATANSWIDFFVNPLNGHRIVKTSKSASVKYRQYVATQDGIQYNVYFGNTWADEYVVGTYVYDKTNKQALVITSTTRNSNGEITSVVLDNGVVLTQYGMNTGMSNPVQFYDATTGEVYYAQSTQEVISKTKVMEGSYEYLVAAEPIGYGFGGSRESEKLAEDLVVGETSTWQLCPASPVIQ